jgi:hypothetical protein
MVLEYVCFSLVCNYGQGLFLAVVFCPHPNILKNTLSVSVPVLNFIFIIVIVTLTALLKAKMVPSVTKRCWAPEK